MKCMDSYRPTVLFVAFFWLLILTMPAQTTLYQDNNFVAFPVGWTITATGSSSATVLPGGTPSTGSNSSALHLRNPRVNSANLNATTPDSLSAALDLQGYSGVSTLQISFDVKLTQVMDPVSGKATTNALWVVLKDSNGGVIVSNLIQRWSGGTAASAIGFGDSDNYPTLGYVDVNVWYHVVLDLPGAGSPGNAVMTVTGLDGSVVHSGTAPYPAVANVAVTQAIASGAADYGQLVFKAGMSWGDFNVDAAITNIRVTASPRSLLSDMSPAVTLPTMPTGSESFTVNLPAPANTTTASVTQFGAATTNADNTAAFNTAITYCRTNSVAKLIVPAGTYRFTQNAALNFSNMRDFEFDGQGSTFVFLHTSDHLINISNSQRVLFKNFAVDWDWATDPLASLVQIIAVASNGDYADLRFVDYTYFPKRDVVLTRSLVPIDPATMSVGYSAGSGLYFGGTHPVYTWLSDNVIRFYANDNTTSMTRAQLAYALKVGNYCRVQHSDLTISAINMTSNTHLTLSGVNVYSVPGFAFFTWGDQHHWQFLNCNIKKPTGVARAITCTSDGYHTGPQQGYFLMDGCDFGFGGDDCFNFADTAATANRTGTYQITTRKLYNKDPYHVGDVIELRNDDYSPTGFTATLSAITTVNASEGTHQFTFAQAVPQPTGSFLVLFNKRYGARNIIIRNSRFHDNQARGFYLHCQNVTIENSTFFHNQLGAIHINVGYGDGWAEGYGASNIILRGNVIEQANPSLAYPLDKTPALDIYSFLGAESTAARTAYPILHDILIENNTFTDFPGMAIAVTSAQNVTIRGNVFRANGAVANNPTYRGGISAGYSSGIFILDNRWITSPYLTPTFYEDVFSTGTVYIHGNTLGQ